MKIMIKYFPVLILFVNCMSLLPADQRQIRTVVDTKGVKANQAYDRALIWFAKSMNNSNWAIQIKDPAEKRIVANMRLHCTMNTGSDILGNQNIISFVTDFQAKDDRFRITFEDVVFVVHNTQGNDVIQGPTDENEKQQIDAKCLQPIRDSFSSAVKGSTKSVDSNF